jgi:hypothetical protein
VKITRPRQVAAAPAAIVSATTTRDTLDGRTESTTPCKNTGSLLRPTAKPSRPSAPPAIARVSGFPRATTRTPTRGEHELVGGLDPPPLGRKGVEGESRTGDDQTDRRCDAESDRADPHPVHWPDDQQQRDDDKERKSKQHPRPGRRRVHAPDLAAEPAATPVDHERNRPGPALDVRRQRSHARVVPHNRPAVCDDPCAPRGRGPLAHRDPRGPDANERLAEVTGDDDAARPFGGQPHGKIALVDAGDNSRWRRQDLGAVVDR